MRSPFPSQALSGPEKVGALLIALGPEYAAAVVSRLSPAEVEQVMECIASMEGVAEGLRDRILSEFRRTYEAQPEITPGGIEYARAVLEHIPSEHATEAVERLNTVPTAGQFLSTATAEQLQALLAEEHPQLVATVLLQIPSDRAAAVMGGLPGELQLDTARRMVESRPVPADTITLLDRELARHDRATPQEQGQARSGSKALADVLSVVERSVERSVLEGLDPELAAAVRKEMFVFEDLPKLQDRDLQVVLQNAGSHDLALALKEADEVLQQTVFNNVSERVAQAVMEDMELSQRVRPREIEAAQQRVAGVARELIRSGQITLNPAEATEEEEASVEDPQPAE